MRLRAKESHPRLAGRLAWLTLEVKQPETWLGPAAAVIGGLISGGSPLLTPAGFLMLALLLILVDPLIGGILVTLSRRDWRQALDLLTGQSPVPGSPLSTESLAVLRLPFTRPGSPSDRLSQALAVGLYRWRTALWPAWGQDILTLVGLFVLVLVVSGQFGSVALFLALIMVLLALIRAGRLWRGEPESPLLFALDSVGLPWLIGLLSMSPQNSLALAGGIALAALVTLAHDGFAPVVGRSGAWHRHLALLLLAVLLVAAGRPVHAWLSILCWGAMTLVEGEPFEKPPAKSSLLGGELFLIAAFLVAALAMR